MAIINIIVKNMFDTTWLFSTIEVADCSYHLEVFQFLSHQFIDLQSDFVFNFDPLLFFDDLGVMFLTVVA